MEVVEERYLRLPEIAQRLDVHPRTVTRWIQDGKLVAYKFGNEYRIAESDLKDFLERHRTGGSL